MLESIKRHLFKKGVGYMVNIDNFQDEKSAINTIEKKMQTSVTILPPLRRIIRGRIFWKPYAKCW